MFNGLAKVQYYGDYCVAYVDQQIVEYYRSLIPKSHYVQPQAFPAHITVSRRRIEKPKVDNWGKYQGQSIWFEYDNTINTCGLYYWLNCYSSDIGAIRLGLGLEVYRPGFSKYHLTIGNKKNVNFSIS